MAEIDDRTLAEFQSLKALVAEIQASPEARKEMDRAIKKVRPQIETEEDVAEKYAAPVRAELEATRKELRDYIQKQDDERKAWQDNEDKRNMHNAFASLRKEKGYTDDGINEIADLMVKRGIADPVAASLLYDNLHPAPPEIVSSSYEPQKWNIAPEEDLKRLFTDESGWEADAVRAAINDVRGQAQVH